MQTEITTGINRNFLIQLAEEAKGPVKSFLSDCYVNEVKMIDDAPDMTTAEKVEAHRETNRYYGMILLVLTCVYVGIRII